MQRGRKGAAEDRENEIEIFELAFAVPHNISERKLQFANVFLSFCFLFSVSFQCRLCADKLSKFQNEEKSIKEMRKTASVFIRSEFHNVVSFAGMFLIHSFVRSLSSRECIYCRHIRRTM